MKLPATREKRQRKISQICQVCCGFERAEEIIIKRNQELIFQMANARSNATLMQTKKGVAAD